MSNKDTGGPAFPGPYADEQGNIEVLWKQQGMTLRDYFAAKALQGMSAEIDDEVRAARWCYEMADAMLDARKK